MADETVLTPPADTDAPAPDDKPVDDKPKDDDAPTDKADAPDDKPSDAPDEPDGDTSDGPPETYELDLPDTVDEALVTEAIAVFREQGLTNDQAKAVAALHARSHDQAVEQWQTTVSGWEEAVKSDADLGGEKFDAVRARTAKLVADFGTPALVEALEMYGFGNHPELVRMLNNVARAMGEDSTPGKNSGRTPTESERLQKMFPSMFDDDGNPKP